MEEEEQIMEHAEVEEQEEEESTHLVRKSRAGNDSSTPATTAAADGGDDEVISYEVFESNGHKIELNGAANGDTPLEKEQKAEELDGVIVNLDKESAGELQKSENNLIFYDKVEGFKSTPNGERQFAGDSGHDQSEIKNISISEINTSPQGYLANNSLSISNLQPSQASLQEHSASYSKPAKEIESAEVDLINEDDLEETDYDVEKVIQKQNTHELICPNCNSCITRRVILRKRKRGVRIAEEEVKRNKLEDVVSSKLGVGPARGSGGQVPHTDEVDIGDNQIPREEDEERERGPAIFRCLSCFSIFIPTGKNWFTSMFAPKHESAVEQVGSSQTVVQKGESGQPSVSQKARAPDQASDGVAGAAVNSDTLESQDNILPSPSQKPLLNGKPIIGAGDKLASIATAGIASGRLKDLISRKEDKNEASVITPPIMIQATNGELVEDANVFSQKDGLKLLISSNKGSHDEQISNQITQLGGADKEAIQVVATSVSANKASDVNGKANISVAVPHQQQDVTASFVTHSVVDNNNANFKNSKEGRVYPTDISQHIMNETKFEIHSGESLNIDNISAIEASVAQEAGKDAVITIDAQPAVASQPMHGTIVPAESATALQSATQDSIAGGERTEARKEFEIEVIKSIVYGGLAESITSLSVVSSAAGGGAGTLNVIALGMANLFGGFFAICHNLWELKSDRVEERSNEVSNAPEERDRYRQLLGRRQNFMLHAIVAIISYIIFGLVPPIIYGFSFRKTDDKQLKLLVVAASSLVCIVLLAIGRAYVKNRPKPYIKSVTTFVVVGFMASGVSYAAGVLIERLLQKLGLFDSGSVPNLLLPEMAKEGSRWASY